MYGVCARSLKLMSPSWPPADFVQFVEYDQMMYLDAGFQGSLENIHEKFEPNHGPPPAPYVDADMFVYTPSMATARLLLHMLAVMMRPRTTIADHQQAAAG